MTQQVVQEREIRTAQPVPPSPWRHKARNLASEYMVLALTLLYFLAVLPFLPDVATRENLGNIFSNMLPLLVVAIGQTIVLITGGIDLSLTSILAMASVAGAWLMNDRSGVLAGHPLAVPAAIALMLLVGLAIGLFNGLAITLFSMPPFMVTLTTMMFVSGLAIYCTQSRNIAMLPDAFLEIQNIWVTLAIVAVLAIASHLMLRRILIGRWLYAIGLNAKAARVSGVPVPRTITFAYVFSGFCAALAAILYTARLETGSPTLGKEILLDVVGATVIGGTSLFGGKGKISWTFYGVLLFTLLANTLNLWGLQHFEVMMIKGAVILLAASLDLVRNRILAGS